jgi:hypothetical protein
VKLRTISKKSIRKQSIIIFDGESYPKDHKFKKSYSKTESYGYRSVGIGEQLPAQKDAIYAV